MASGKSQRKRKADIIGGYLVYLIKKSEFTSLVRYPESRLARRIDREIISRIKRPVKSTRNMISLRCQKWY